MEFFKKRYEKSNRYGCFFSSCAVLPRGDPHALRAQDDGGKPVGFFSLCAVLLRGGLTRYALRMTAVNRLAFLITIPYKFYSGSTVEAVSAILRSTVILLTESS